MSLDLFKMKLSESPIQQAMDVYYDQFDALVNAGSAHKVVLTSNIVDFPIRSNTPLYNSYISRSFGDRAIVEGSPHAVDENFQGPANINDRFSRQFEKLLRKAVASVNVELDQATLNKIDNSERNLLGYENDLNDLIDKILTDWDDHRSRHLRDASDEEIQMRFVAWLDIHRLRRRMESIISRIDSELTYQEQLVSRVSGEEDAQIYHAYNAYRNTSVALPKYHYIESDYNIDPIKIGNPLIVGTNPTWADIGVDIDPLVDWDNFLEQDGARNFSISRSDITTETHERKWSASARVRYGFFFSARIKASEHTRMKNTLSDSSSIAMNFNRISEVWLRRGNWYDSSIFQLPKVVDILSKNKKLAANLKYSVSSLIVGRGFSLTLAFNTTNHYEYFRQFSASGSAKILNVFPVGRGSVNETSTKVEDNEAAKSVSFVDDPKLCRLLGFKVEEMHTLISDEEALIEMGNFDFSSPEFESYLKENFGLSDDYKHKQLL